MNDDDFFAQRNTFNIKHGSFKREDENLEGGISAAATIEDPFSNYPRLTFKE
jgi:hypothetical protein